MNPVTRPRMALFAAPFFLFLGFATLVAVAKTPDGSPPSQENPCSGLSGAAYGLCNAYCEAQDCDVHPRPSCDRLRGNFQKQTGASTFPCDVRCGDGIVNGTEECDPAAAAACPSSSPAGAFVPCNADCTCPTCGNNVLEPGEQCDPPGSGSCPASSPVGAFVACSDICGCPQCGNGAIEPGEVCDPPFESCGDFGFCNGTCSDCFTD